MARGYDIDTDIPVITEGRALPKWFIERQLELIRDERQYRANNDLDRRRDQRYFDGIHPEDDNFSGEEWLKNVRVNQISPHVNLIVGEMGKRMHYPQPYALGGDQNPDFFSLVQLRGMQSRALFTASGFHQHRTSALMDAMTSGDGWMRYGLRPKNPGGGIELFAEHKPWDEILFDSYHCKQNGDIQGCRWLLHYTLVTVRDFAAAYPGFKSKAMDVCRSRPLGNSSPVDSVYGTGGDFFPMSSDSHSPMSEGETEQYVVYGVMFFRHPGTQELYKYPFLTDRGLTELVPLKAPAQPYSHHKYPFLRWVSGAYLQERGLPYTPMRHKMGLERIQQTLLRASASKIGGDTIMLEETAAPMGADGEKRMSIDRFERYLMRQSREPNKFYIFGEGALSQKKVIVQNNNAEAKQLADLLQVLSAIQATSGGAPHAALVGGGGKSPHSGTSLREHLDNSLAGHRMLLDTDKMCIMTAGRMNLYFIDDYGDELPLLAFMDEDGEHRYIMNELTKGDMEKAKLVGLLAKDMGIGVRAQERRPDSVAETAPIVIEMMKSFAGNIQGAAMAAITTGKLMMWSSAMMDGMIEGFMHMGARIPEHYLSPRLRELKVQVDAQQDEKRAKDEAVEDAAVGAEIEKTASEAEKNRGQAAQAKATAAKQLAEADGAEGSSESVESLLQKVSDLQKRNAELEAAAGAKAG